MIEKINSVYLANSEKLYSVFEEGGLTEYISESVQTSVKESIDEKVKLFTERFRKVYEKKDPSKVSNIDNIIKSYLKKELNSK
eukprot:UN30465